MHATIFRNTCLRAESHTIRFLSPTIALTHVHWQMTGAGGVSGWEVGAVRHGLMSLVLVEEGEGWLITAAHSTDIVPQVMPKQCV